MNIPWLTNNCHLYFLFINSNNPVDICEIIPCICSVCASPVLFGGDVGNRRWLRNSPSCSSAISVLTLRDRQPGFISGRVTSPDSSRLRATSAKHMSYSRKHISHTHTKWTTKLYVSQIIIIINTIIIIIIELTSWLLLSILLLSCPTEKSHTNLQKKFKKSELN